MPQVYVMQDFSQYIIIDKLLYKKAKKCKHESYKYQYRGQRKIKRCIKNGIEGYYLESKEKENFTLYQNLNTD